jgi:predicted RNase H-like HicB family nuclease
MTLTAILTPAPEGGFVAFNPETGATTLGETLPEALANLKEAAELYLEEFSLRTADEGAPELVAIFNLLGVKTRCVKTAGRDQGVYRRHVAPGLLEPTSREGTPLSHRAPFLRGGPWSRTLGELPAIPRNCVTREGAMIPPMAMFCGETTSYLP